jgi:hypothetical protein
MAVLVRLGLLALGMAAIEIGLGSALIEESPVGWALILVVGVPSMVAGSAGFMVPLLEPHRREDSADG